MIGLGTLVNMGAILIGASIGSLLQGVLRERFQITIMNGLSLAVMFIGISGALQGIFVVEGTGLVTSNIMLMIASLAIGGFFGEWMDIETRLERLGERLKVGLKVKGEKGRDFVDGFVSSSLLFCVGAMAIIGSLNDGLSGDATMLYAKAVIDGTTAIFFASTLGIGVFFSILPLGLYQGLITISARYVEPYLGDMLISQISLIGSVLIFGIGINMLFGKKIKVGNLLPAVLVPVCYGLIKGLL